MNVDEESFGMEFLVLQLLKKLIAASSRNWKLFGVIARIVKMKKRGKHNKSFLKSLKRKKRINCQGIALLKKFLEEKSLKGAKLKKGLSKCNGYRRKAKFS